MEAVFVSYALYGRWDAQEAAMWLPQDCKGMNGNKFLSLAQDATLLNQNVKTEEARGVFCKLYNMVSVCAAVTPPLLYLLRVWRTIILFATICHLVCSVCASNLGSFESEIVC